MAQLMASTHRCTVIHAHTYTRTHIHTLFLFMFLSLTHTQVRIFVEYTPLYKGSNTLP